VPTRDPEAVVHRMIASTLADDWFASVDALPVDA
jgi:hypothetical protein